MADQQLTITIKDAYANRVKNAIEFFAEHEIRIVNTDVKFRFKYSFLSKQGGENNRQFYERFLKETLRAFVRCYELGSDRDREIAAVNAVPPPSQNVPDEIVE